MYMYMNSKMDSYTNRSKSFVTVGKTSLWCHATVEKKISLNITGKKYKNDNELQ